jgi:hypothetical protein
MAKINDGKKHKKVVKSTSQADVNPKTSSMNKHHKRSYKPYRGQGK